MNEQIVMGLISLIIETLPSALFFWWATYYFMVKRKKLLAERREIITHNIIIILILTFLVFIDKNSFANGSVGVVAIVLSIISCLILKKIPSNK
jgi:hypothetical protein